MNKALLPLAALTAACLVPAASTRAQDTDTTRSRPDASVSGTVMDVTQFRESLEDLRTMMRRMRENNRLALAASDPLPQSQYRVQNRQLLANSLGTLAGINNVWKDAEIPAQFARAEGSGSEDRWGSANMVRFTGESQDTAFVRNAVWEIEQSLRADKLNGRQPMITDRMMSLIDAAIHRAENPDFRMASAWDASRLRRIEWSRSEDREMVAQAPREESVVTERREETTTTTENEVTSPEPAVTPAPEPEPVVTPAPEPEPAVEEPMEEPDAEPVVAPEETPRGALPQTGGDPALLLFLGSGITGLGALLRKRG